MTRIITPFCKSLSSHPALSPPFLLPLLSLHTPIFSSPLALCYHFHALFISCFVVHQICLHLFAIVHPFSSPTFQSFTLKVVFIPAVLALVPFCSDVFQGIVVVVVKSIMNLYVMGFVRVRCRVFVSFPGIKYVGKYD